MAYQMAATAVTLNDLDCHSLVAGLFKCNRSNICAAFYMISTDSVLALCQFACFFLQMSIYSLVAALLQISITVWSVDSVIH